MDAVFRHYLIIVEEEAAAQKGFERAVQHMTALLYAYNRLLALTQPEWLKWEFDALKIIIEWVGLNKNTKKIVSTV